MHKTFKEKLRPKPEQERALDVVVWCCRTLYNAALEQRKTAWSALALIGLPAFVCGMGPSS